MKEQLIRLYKKSVIDKPFIGIAFSVLLVIFLGYFVKDFKLDASADSLVLENDKSLEYYRSIKARYGSDDFLIITYSPYQDMFSDQVLDNIDQLKQKLKKIESVEKVVTLLDVPLISSPPLTYKQIKDRTPLLRDKQTDREMAKTELSQGVLYKNLIMNPEAKTTAIQVIFKRNDNYQRLLSERNQLREKRLTDGLSFADEKKLEQVSTEFKQYADQLQAQVSEDIVSVREILNQHRNMAKIHLGGVPMISADMIDYINNDIKVFGSAVLILIIVLLSLVFRKIHWVAISIIICFAASFSMSGLLGLMDWRVSVVSSNFISLMLIITLSLTVHLIVRYRELHKANPLDTQKQLVWQTVKSKAEPAFFTAVTTMVAFASLVISGIRPVMDFGWMMIMGISLSLILSFVLFPSAAVLMKPGKAHEENDVTSRITLFFAAMVKGSGSTVIIFYLLLAVLSAVGMSWLSVENRFIDYFKKDTEIYQGMVTIDRELGGTTPLDVIIDPDKDYYEFLKEMSEDGVDNESAGISGSSYWFDIFALETVDKVHSYLESLPETGKVLSMSTTMKLLTSLNEGKQLENIHLSIMYKRLPDDIKETLFSPYMSADGNQVRFSIRVFDSDKNLKRQQLLEKIKKDLNDKFEFESSQVKLSGMMVLYNNMLQSLFQSQILTLGFVFIAIMLMFLILFRSIRLSLIAIVPNLIAAGFVLGLMGWLGINLDIMTITIAAITIGIAVDDTIHYVHRYVEEYQTDQNAWAAVERCHKSIGKAMYYTTITITLGFSVLILSNFLPTIYFGLLTGGAMIIALIADLTLLPLLLVMFYKPKKDLLAVEAT